MTDAPADRRLRPAEGVLFREEDGETVLVDTRNGEYFGLDEAGSVIWQQVVDGSTLSEVVAALRGRYDVDEALLRRDTDQLIGELLEAGLLEEVID